MSWQEILGDPFSHLMLALFCSIPVAMYINECMLGRVRFKPKGPQGILLVYIPSALCVVFLERAVYLSWWPSYGNIIFMGVAAPFLLAAVWTMGLMFVNYD